MFVLGIDPGISGALAFYEPEKNELVVYDMPTQPVKVAKKKKNVIDIYQLAQIVDSFSSLVTKAVIEEVSAMPGQGVTSMFSFGFSTGCAHMAVASAFIPLVTVRPGTWKKAMRLSRDKDASRQEASRLMPKHISNWTRKKDDGRAEAALLAYYLAHIDKTDTDIKKPSIADLL